ncbi:glutamate--cysteine ligase, partial [Coemansia sp. RSA 1836]
MGYVVVKRDDAARLMVLSPRAANILGELGCSADENSVGNHPLVRARRREPPYLRAFSVQQLVTEIPECLRARRRLLKSKLNGDEMLLSITQFPLLGATTGTHIDGQGPTNGPLLRSQLLSDDCLHPIPPFALEIDGIIERRGAVPHTAVPVFHDTNTPWPFIDPGLSPAALDLGILRLPDASTSSGGSRDRDSGCSIGASDRSGNNGPAAAAAN